MSTPAQKPYSSSTPAPPPGHPEIDYTKWTAPGPSDVRSPCPMINALCNHGILPHSGRGLTKEGTVAALASALNLSEGIGNTFVKVAATSNDAPGATTFDVDMLRKHGLIEHDVSLSRQDEALGNNWRFDEWWWGKYLAHYGERKETDFESASAARMARVEESRKAHEAAGKTVEYGIKEVVLSYGETALFMGILGDREHGKVPLEYLKVLFEQERLPFKEGWRKTDKPLTQADMNHLIFNLMKANEKKAEEAHWAGLGTVHAVTAAVTAHMPEYCTIM